MDDKVSIGGVHTVEYTEAGTYLKTKIAKPESNVDIWDLWASSFKDTKSARVCLSGGIDSQFGYQVAKKLGVELSAVSYASVWQGSVVNSSDVLAAQRYCNKHDIPLEIVELDVYDFLNSSELTDLALKYKCTSPQVAIHLKFMSGLGNNDPIIMGGDIPALLGRRQQDNLFSAILSIQKSEIIATHAPYYNMASKNGIELFKDLFFLDPAIYYLGLCQNLNILKTKQSCVWYDLAISEDDYDVGLSFANRGNIMLYKAEIYKSLGTDIFVPILKNTGFEDLKKHLAAQTGVYNEFDLKFRNPLVDLVSSEPWFKNFAKETLIDRTISRNPIFKEIANEFSNLLNNTDNLKNLSLYRFDF